MGKGGAPPLPVTWLSTVDPTALAMTRVLPFTQASLRRAIEAARKAGLQVTGIRPDGTLLVQDVENAPRTVPSGGIEEQSAPSSKWEDVEA
jgi:hypothetical protein